LKIWLKALPQKSKLSANGAEYESQGQARNASPLESNQKYPALKESVGLLVNDCRYGSRYSCIEFERKNRLVDLSLFQAS
jgi:hypothetical protein